MVEYTLLKSSLNFAVEDVSDGKGHEPDAHDDHQNQEHCFKVQHELVLVDVVALATVGHDLLVPLRIVLDVSAGPVEEDALYVQPNRNDDHIGEAYDCSVDRNHHLQVNASDVD